MNQIIFVTALLLCLALASASPRWLIDPLAYSATPSAWVPPPPWLAEAAPLGPDGQVIETPEVAAAAAAHFAAHEAAVVATWTPPPPAWATLTWAHGAASVGLDGHVIDTPEVAAAKAAHYAAQAIAAAAAEEW